MVHQEDDEQTTIGCSNPKVKDIQQLEQRYEVLVAGREQDYNVTVDLKNNFMFCTCPQCYIHKKVCPHLRAALQELKLAELPIRKWME